MNRTYETNEKKMASSRRILLYWTQENNWSILKENCIKEGSLTKGSAVQAYYMRKVYPAILIAISENKSSIERIEAHFKKFLLGVSAHVDEEEERIRKIRNEFIPFMTDTPVDPAKVTATQKIEKKLDGLVPEGPSMTDKLQLSTPKKFTAKKSAATPEKMATPKKIAEKKMTTPEKTTPSKKLPKIDGLVPQMKGSNQETNYFRKETENNNSRDRRIRKLEEDVKALKEDNKYLRRKVRKLEERKEEGNEVKQSSVQEVEQPSADVDVECSSVSAQQEVTIDDLKKSVQHLKCSQDIFKVLCLKIFTKDELKNSSRTGEKTIKCGDTARPPLDVKKLAKLELLVLQCISMDKDLFDKKLENLQKVLRRS